MMKRNACFISSARLLRATFSLFHFLDVGSYDRILTLVSCVQLLWLFYLCNINNVFNVSPMLSFYTLPCLTLHMLLLLLLFFFFLVFLLNKYNKSSKLYKQCNCTNVQSFTCTTIYLHSFLFSHEIVQLMKATGFHVVYYILTTHDKILLFLFQKQMYLHAVIMHGCYINV